MMRWVARAASHYCEETMMRVYMLDGVCQVISTIVLLDKLLGRTVPFVLLDRKRADWVRDIELTFFIVIINYHIQTATLTR